MNDSHPTSLDCLCSSEESSSEINIICSWATSGKQDSIVGQHHLRHLAVRPEYKSKGCPILISAKYESDVTHDFSFSPLVRLTKLFHLLRTLTTLTSRTHSFIHSFETDRRNGNFSAQSSCEVQG